MVGCLLLGRMSLLGIRLMDFVLLIGLVGSGLLVFLLAGLMGLVAFRLSGASWDHVCVVLQSRFV